ncbi:ABC transporter permease [Halosimplex sp. J119]
MRYTLKRTGQAVLTLFVVVTLAFVMFRLMPGGPLESIRTQLMREAAASGDQINMERINSRVELMTNIRPDEPIYVQYIDYMGDVILNQDFGRSIWQQEPVFELLFKAMPWSVFISIYGLLLGFTTNIFLGAVMAYNEGTRFDSGLTGVIIALNSVPYYVAAILMLVAFSYQLELTPIGGRYDPSTTQGFNLPFMISVVQHAALPIFSSFVVGFGGGALGMRGNSVRILGEDYVRAARIRGLSNSIIAARYVGKNAILPMYTGLMIGIAGIFSSSVILEQIFTYPGVGWYTFGALENRDYPLLMGSFIFYTTITIVGILIADLTYGLIDPRISQGEK